MEKNRRVRLAGPPLRSLRLFFSFSREILLDLYFGGGVSRLCATITELTFLSFDDIQQLCGDGSL